MLKTLKQHFNINYSYTDKERGFKVYDVFYKKDPTIQINCLGMKGNNLHWGCWVNIDHLFNQSYI